MDTVYCGIDLHASQITYHLIIKDDNAKIVRLNGKVYTDQLYSKLFSKMDKNWYVCVEASSCTFWFVKLIKPYVKEVIVINPQSFKEMYLSGKKTDAIDAKQLANRLKMHIEDGDSKDDFPQVYVPEDGIQELRMLFSTYNFLNKQIIALKNKIYSLFRSRMILIDKKDIETSIPSLVENEDIDDLLKEQILILYETLINMLVKKNEIKIKIETLGIKYYEEQIKLLVSIQGISILGATAIIADVATIDRFKSAKKFSKYLKSAPKIDSSNEKSRIGNISKRGRKTAYNLIIQGLQHIKDGNSNFRSFYETKCKGKKKCKVRAAIVRKTIVAIYYILKNIELYRELNQQLYERKLKEIERYKKKSSQAA